MILLGDPFEEMHSSHPCEAANAILLQEILKSLPNSLWLQEKMLPQSTSAIWL